MSSLESDQDVNKLLETGQKVYRLEWILRLKTLLTVLHMTLPLCIHAMFFTFFFPRQPKALICFHKTTTMCHTCHTHYRLNHWNSKLFTKDKVLSNTATVLPYQILWADKLCEKCVWHFCGCTKLRVVSVLCWCLELSLAFRIICSHVAHWPSVEMGMSSLLSLPLLFFLFSAHLFSSLLQASCNSSDSSLKTQLKYHWTYQYRCCTFKYYSTMHTFSCMWLFAKWLLFFGNQNSF